MDWSKNFFFFVVCASGLVVMSYSTDGAYPNLETAQRFEICVVGGLSRSTLFSTEEKSHMSKILKESGTRMRNMGADPTNVNNARTMLRLFAAALANLVHRAHNTTNRFERKQNYTSVLEICSESLPKSAATELTDEVTKILSSMENKKSHKNESTSGKGENSLDKQVEPSAEVYQRSKKREKRSPQEFQPNPPLDAVITGVLITTPSFGRTFKDGLAKQDAVYYSTTIVEAGLTTNGYDYNTIHEALDEVTNDMSNLFFMPQTYDYASAIGNSINTVLARRGIANFADGVGIGNAMISKLEEITAKPSSDFSFPSSFESVASSSVWDSGISDTQQPPFQLNPRWETPPAPAFQFDSSPKAFEPDKFIDSNSRFPLNPSFNPNPIAPSPAFDFGSPNLPDFSSPSANFPFPQAPSSALSDYFTNTEFVPDPFPVDQLSQENSQFSNQPTEVSREKSNSFGFDNMGSQDFPFTSFVNEAPPQNTEFFNQQSFQAPQINQESFQEPQINQKEFQAPQVNPQLFQASPVNQQTFQEPQINQQSFQPPQVDQQTFQAPQINQQNFQTPQINQHKFDSFELGISQTPVTGTDTFIEPTYLQESASPSELKDPSFSFDQTPILNGNPDQMSNPPIEINPARPADISFTSGNLETALSSQTASGQPVEIPDPYVGDVTTIIENTLGLSEDFSSNFDQNMSPLDAASIATAMTRLALSQYDSMLVSDVAAKIKSAIYDMPTSSSTADYAHTIANTFMKAMQDNDLLNSVNSKKMADNLISGLKDEMNRRKALTDAQTTVQTSSLGTEIPIGGSNTAISENGRSQAVAEIFTNPDVSSTYTSVDILQDNISGSAATSGSQTSSNADFTVPLTQGPTVQLGNDSSIQNVPTTTFSLLDATEPMKLTSIIDLLYSPFATTQATPTKDPYMAALTDAAKNPDTLFGFLMEQVNSSLKALNATPMPKTTKINELVPFTTDASVASVTVNNGPSSTAGQGPQTSSQATSTQTQDIQLETESTTESSTSDRYDEELSEFSQRVSAVATSTIAYIRSGKVNTDELCGKLNTLVFMVDIPPVDNCTEIAVIDYLLNVLNAVILTLRNR